MTFVTKLSFASGDHDVLAETVQDLKSTLERKGAECKGPHATPAETVRVPLYKQLRAGDEFSPWNYDVYKRSMEIHGGRRSPREVVGRDFPDSIHVGRGRPEEEAARTPSGLIFKAARPRATQSSSPVATIRSPETNHPSSFARSAIFGWNTHATSPKIGIIDAPTIA